MQLIKLLNIALIAFIITLVLSIFMPKPPAQTLTMNEISLLTSNKELSIPNMPKITLHNQTAESFSYDACRDLSIYKGSVLLPDVASAFQKEGKCIPVAVSAGSGITLDFSPLQPMFASENAIGSYVVSINTPKGQRTQSLEVTRPGVVRSVLSGLIYEPIYNLFVTSIKYLPGHELGWAIILVTIIIRLIILIPQNKMLENGRRMAEIAPRIQALQKEYENDRATLGMKMMELYKKEGVSPLGSCLPLLIQFPILIGLYWVITGITDPSNVYHVYSFLRPFNPTNINTDFFGINLLQIGGTLGIIMAIILAGTQFLQSYLLVKSQPPIAEPKKDEKPKEGELPKLDPRLMQKFTLFVLPIIVGVSGLLFPLGLGLYWWIGILFMIAQQAYVHHRAKIQKSRGEIVKRKK